MARIEDSRTMRVHEVELKWHMKSRLQEFVRDESLADVHFVCEDKQVVHTHKLVLCAVSKRMTKLFNEIPEWLRDNVTVHVPDVDGPALRQLLDSLYTSELRITKQQLPQVRWIQQFLGIDILNMSDEVDLPIQQRQKSNFSLDAKTDSPKTSRCYLNPSFDPPSLPNQPVTMSSHEEALRQVLPNHSVDQPESRHSCNYISPLRLAVRSNLFPTVPNQQFHDKTSDGNIINSLITNRPNLRITCNEPPSFHNSSNTTNNLNQLAQHLCSSQELLPQFTSMIHPENSQHDYQNPLFMSATSTNQVLEECVGNKSQAPVTSTIVQQPIAADASNQTSDKINPVVQQRLSNFSLDAKTDSSKTSRCYLNPSFDPSSLPNQPVTMSSHEEALRQVLPNHSVDQPESRHSCNYISPLRLAVRSNLFPTVSNQQFHDKTSDSDIINPLITNRPYLRITRNEPPSFHNSSNTTNNLNQLAHLCPSQEMLPQFTSMIHPENSQHDYQNPFYMSATSTNQVLEECVGNKSQAPVTSTIVQQPIAADASNQTVERNVSHTSPQTDEQPWSSPPQAIEQHATMKRPQPLPRTKFQSKSSSSITHSPEHIQYPGVEHQQNKLSQAITNKLGLPLKAVGDMLRQVIKDRLHAKSASSKHQVKLSQEDKKNCLGYNNNVHGSVVKEEIESTERSSTNDNYSFPGSIKEEINLNTEYNIVHDLVVVKKDDIEEPADKTDDSAQVARLEHKSLNNPHGVGSFDCVLKMAEIKLPRLCLVDKVVRKQPRCKVTGFFMSGNGLTTKENVSLKEHIPKKDTERKKRKRKVDDTKTEKHSGKNTPSVPMKKTKKNAEDNKTPIEKQIKQSKPDS